MWYLYVLYNKEINRYYVGCSNNINRRLGEHNQNIRKKRYTEKQQGKWALVYKEVYETLKESRRRESQIKKQKSRKYIENLILSGKKQECAGSSMDRATAF